ncbi:MAG: DUF4242 domain-containing protein [Oscillatoriophycideae cyanobacterium NC_groundwater_1537_Pr4_S-0.65um_50_18]|nr:DUF4242 domain-containing protein [Oscillatoriophycideae cyanobacterium NC_groundwater_1537_Pr4_S-0.65um_50_18]
MKLNWIYSLLSTDRHRIICTFEAPDAESLRESYRRVGLPSRPIWAGDRIRPEANAPQPDSKMRHIMEGTYPPLSETDWNEISRKILLYCAEYGIEWVQSYISLDRSQVIYELNAPDIALLQDIEQKLGIPIDRVWSADVLCA